MKKYLIKISMLIFGLTLTISCNQDSLEIPQKSVIDLEEFYKNAGPNEAEQLISSIYDQFYEQIQGITTQIFLDVLSDDHFAGGNSFGDGASGFNITGLLNINPQMPTNPNTMYVNAYKIIYWANCILEKIPATTDARVNRVKAEANFFRALMMFELVRWFGTPPFVDHVIDIEGGEEFLLPNGDHFEIITWCLARMQEAADALPALSGIGTQRAFHARISKHGALAYKGKMALWYGTRYKNPAILAQAVEPLKTVVNSGLYDLLEDISRIGRMAADFSREYIFEHNAEDSGGYPNNQSDNRHTWTNWRPENMIVPGEIWNYGWGWDPPTGDFGDFLKNHHGGDIENPRFKATLRTYDQVMAMDYSTVVGTPGIFAPIDANQGYFRYRGLNFASEVYMELAGSGKKSKANTHFMRYAEVLLMYAEAKFRVDNDADGTGLAALNKVRTRAKLPPLAALTEQAIKDERRAELWSEGERYFDLVRWGDAATVLKDKGKIQYTFWGYEKDASGNVIEPKKWKIVVSTPPAGSANGWDPKYELMPFPYVQLSVNPNLKQNPGW